MSIESRIQTRLRIVVVSLSLLYVFIGALRRATFNRQTSHSLSAHGLAIDNKSSLESVQEFLHQLIPT